MHKIIIILTLMLPLITGCDKSTSPSSSADSPELARARGIKVQIDAYFESKGTSTEDAIKKAGFENVNYFYAMVSMYLKQNPGSTPEKAILDVLDTANKLNALADANDPKTTKPVFNAINPGRLSNCEDIQISANNIWQAKNDGIPINDVYFSLAKTYSAAHLAPNENDLRIAILKKIYLKKSIAWVIYAAKSKEMVGRMVGFIDQHCDDTDLQFQISHGLLEQNFDFSVPQPSTTPNFIE